MIPWKATIDMKTRIFDFKILNSMLFLNPRLYKYESSIIPSMLSLSGVKETPQHLFANCSHLYPLSWLTILHCCSLVPSVMAWYLLWLCTLYPGWVCKGVVANSEMLMYTTATASKSERKINKMTILAMLLVVSTL